MPRPTRSLLGDSVMLRIASLFYLDPESRRQLGQITAALDDTHRQTVIRALNDLVEQGYLLKNDEEPPRYQANPHHYLYDELRSIALKTFGGFETLARAIVDSHAIVYAAIFGSFARGDAGPSSDIDLLLVTTAMTDLHVAEIVGDLAAAAHAIGREINPTVYDEAEFRARSESVFLQQIFAGPLLVLKD